MAFLHTKHPEKVLNNQDTCLGIDKVRRVLENLKLTVKKGANIMKSKLFVILMIVCLFPVLSQAQIISNYGVKTAFTRSIFDVEEYINFTTWRSGFNVAVYAEKDVSDFMSFLLQLEYSQKGYIFEQVETNEAGTEIQDVRANTRLDYISVPLFLKIKYPTQKITPFVTIGPRFDYLANFNKGEFKFTSVTFTDDFADYLKSYVFGGSVSCGLQIPASNKYDISIEFRYNYDFSDSAKELVQYSVKNKSFDIWLGIEF